jgi:ketosteroid isomerase-like protein
MSDSQKPAELFRRSLDAFLAKDMRAWADLCAEKVLVEFPFAPAGTPSRLDGRVAIFEYLRNYPKIIDVHEIDSLEIYPTDRPDTVIGEWSVKGHVIPNGNAYNMSYATFVTRGLVGGLGPFEGRALAFQVLIQFSSAVVLVMLGLLGLQILRPLELTSPIWRTSPALAWSPGRCRPRRSTGCR